MHNLNVAPWVDLLRISIVKLEGFQWLGQYFITVNQNVFWGKASPANFDGRDKSKDLLVCIESEKPEAKVARALDDSLWLSCARKSTCHQLLITQKLNSFWVLQRGTVLGAGFDSKDLTWFSLEAEADKVSGGAWMGHMLSSKHMALDQVYCKANLFQGLIDELLS